MTTSDLDALVEAKHPAPEWVTVRELQQDVNARGGRADLAAFRVWSGARGGGWQRVAYELKRSRGDFSREIDHPEKRAWLEAAFHLTYFVAPAGLVKVDEVPEGWGLYVATAGGELRRTKVAKHRDVGPMPESLTLAVVRALAKRLEAARRRTFYYEGMWLRPEQLAQIVDEEVHHERSVLVSQIADLREQRQALQDAREQLVAPLAVLAREALGWSDGRDIERGARVPTGEDVRRWLAEAAQKAAARELAPLRAAHEAIGRLLAAVEGKP